jgi:signal transduction histidine kinase
MDMQNKQLSIFNEMPFGAMIINENYDIEFLNPYLINEFGPVNDKKCYEYFANKNAPCPWCRNDEVFSGNVINWENSNIPNEKTYFVFESLLRSDQKYPTKLEMWIDITNYKDIEKKLTETEVKLQELNQLKEDCMTFISHELKIPITSIIGFAHTLLTLQLSETKRKKYLHIIEKEGKHLSSMLDSFLNISIIESGRIELELSQISMPTLINKTIDALSNPSGISITTYHQSNLPFIHGDADKLQEILANLLNNAIKYSSSGGKITIKTRCRNNKLIVSIEDSGFGIKEEDQDKIFEMFYRGQQNTQNKKAGTGLGLAITKRLIELHGGRIWVKSKEGVGSTFYFTVPLDTDINEPDFANRT